MLTIKNASRYILTRKNIDRAAFSKSSPSLWIKSTLVAIKAAAAGIKKPTAIDAFSHYYTVIDLATGTKTRLSYDGKEIGYSGGRFSQRSVIFNNKAYIGVNTEEDANAVIYIYDIKTGNVEKGAEVDGRFYFDMIRVIEND